jgi:hypothetical protein
MSEQLTWMVGNRNPSITETITSDGAVVDLTAATVRFKMRASGSSVLKVDQPAVIVAPATNGNVRYDWAAIDVDTANDYLVWWEVTTGGKTQDMGEAEIRFLAHAPEANTYVELGEMKSTLELSGEIYADQDLLLAIESASRQIDAMCGTQFYLGTVGEIRKYTPTNPLMVPIEDANAITSVVSDGTTLVLDTDYARIGTPTNLLRALRDNVFSVRKVNSVVVTGTFGYATVPPEVKQAAVHLAIREFKRSREAPWALVGLEFEGGASRIPRGDPDVDRALRPFIRHPAVA